MRCTGYCTATAYKFDLLCDHLKKFHQPVKYHSVVHIQKNDADIFYFRYGCVVYWGLTEQEERQVLNELVPFQEESVVLIESEKYDVVYGQESKIFSGTIFLPDSEVLKKLAVSHGIAQSVKLTTFENLIQETINTNKNLSEQLAIDGKISLSRREISRRIGKLFMERNSVNLHSDILDTPEFFWEYDVLVPFYTMTINNLDLRPRVEVLNRRLKIVHELFEMLGNILENQHASTLEWIVIVLIATEIITNLVKEVVTSLFFS